MIKNSFHNVPHLITAIKGPLQEIERYFIRRQVQIEAWLREEWRKTAPPFYSSVDLRNAGFKVAPVDTNLFPAGFNNLNPDFIPLCIQAVQDAVEQICPEVSRILLIPESHTRNMFYLENVAALQEILIKAGFEVRLGSLLENLTEPMQVELPSGKKLLLEPLIRNDDCVGVRDFFSCLVLLNNDLSDGIPPILQNVRQKIMPPMDLTWATRLKSTHFRHYQNVSEEFSKTIDLDPWLISPFFRNCGEINFMTREGEECLIFNTETLLAAIAKNINSIILICNLLSRSRLMPELMVWQ